MARRPRSPQQKKRLSLERDRRNVYGENDKASRKNIPRSRAISHREVRRIAKAALAHLGRLEEGAAEVAESTVAAQRLQKGRFRKCADAPLGVVIARKHRRRQKPA